MGLDSDEDDYESLGPGVSTSVSMCAGALAGIGEHSVMYPIDVIKTRMQALMPDRSSRYTNSVAFNVRRLFRTEGFRGSWRGVSAVTVGAGPAHALYFTVYEASKEKLSRTRILATYPSLQPLVNASAGILATIFHDLIMIPSEVVKQRMQVCGSPYKSCRDCGKCVFSGEGVGAFYRSFSTQCLMNIPFHVTNFVVYEHLQSMLNPSRDYSPISHGLAGAFAGGCAAGITTPLDVCKTLLNTQEANVLAAAHGRRAPTNSSLKRLAQWGRLQPARPTTTASDALVGMVNAMRTVYAVRGYSGFLQGLKARVVFQMPATCISWSVYEFFKWYLSHGARSSSTSTRDTPDNTRVSLLNR